MATVNPPKKHKYAIQPAKQKPKSQIIMEKVGDFFTLNKKLILIVTAAVLAAAILIAALVAVLDYYLIDTPYDRIRLADHVTVPGYFGMELSASEVEEAFEKEKTALLKTQATYETVKSGLIEEGYNVTISTEGYIVNSDGTESKVLRGTLTDYEVTDLGNHITNNGMSFSKEIQDAIIGTAVVSVRKLTAEIDYPEDYSLDEFKGQKVKYYITVSKVTKTILPEYTDLVISKLDSRFTTVEEYEEYTYNQVKQDLLWNKMVKDSTAAKYPEDKLKIYRDEYDSYYNTYMAQNKTTFDKLLAELGMSAEEYEKDREEFAQNTVKEEMILYYIIKTKKVRMASADYKAACKTLAEYSGYASVDDMVKDYGEDVVERTVLWDKVKQMMVESAVAVD